MSRGYESLGGGGGGGTSLANNGGRDSFELASLASSSRSSAEESRSGISSSRRLSLSSDQELGDGGAGAGGAGDAEAGGAGESGRPTRHYRSYSVSSAFDFNSHLIPLTTSGGGGGNTAYLPIPGTAGRGGSGGQGANSSSLERRKTLTFTNALSLLLSLQIGSGIFSSPSQVNLHAGTPGASLIIWLVAGLLAWTGAASYAELGGAIPLNGGAQAYLRYTFGEGWAFVFAWTAVTVLKPGSAAIIAIIFGEYFNRVLFGPNGGEGEAEWANKISAVVALLVVTLLNGVSTRLTAKLSDVFMVLKVGSLLAITVIGVVVATTGLNGDGLGASTEWRDRNWFQPLPVNANSTLPGGEGNSTDVEPPVGNYALALYAGLWAFDGWDNVNYVTGEMLHPARDLPRTIHLAMPIVIVCYLLANVAYYLVLPSSVVVSSTAIAVEFGDKVFGPIGGIIFALTVSVSCFGALNATSFTSGRLVYVAGKEGYLPSIFGRLGLGLGGGGGGGDGSRPERLDDAGSGGGGGMRGILSRLRNGNRPWETTPIPAILLNTALTALYIILGTFSTLLTFYGVATYTFYFLTVLGLILLRARSSSKNQQLLEERPYKTWITTPIIFCCVSLFLVTRGVFAAPGETCVVALFVGVGWPLYYWRVGGGWEGCKSDVGGGRLGGWWKRWRK